MNSTEQVGLEAGSPLALRLTERQVLTTKLRRIDREGTLVTGLPHPPVVQTGRQLELAWHDGGRWQMLPVAVAATRVGGHVDAGFLRLQPLPDGPEDAEQETESDAPAATEEHSADAEQAGASQPLRKAGDVPAAGAQVALRLASGRVLGTKVHALDESAIVLALPHPSLSPRARCSRSRGRAGRSGTRSRPPSARRARMESSACCPHARRTSRRTGARSRATGSR